MKLFPLDSSDSSTSTDVLDEAVVSTKQPNSNRKKKPIKIYISNNRLSTKERKKVSFFTRWTKLLRTCR